MNKTHELTEGTPVRVADPVGLRGFFKRHYRGNTAYVKRYDTFGGRYMCVVVMPDGSHLPVSPGLLTVLD